MISSSMFFRCRTRRAGLKAGMTRCHAKAGAAAWMYILSFALHFAGCAAGTGGRETESRDAACSSPVSLAADPVRGLVYAAEHGACSIAVIDPSGMDVVRRLPLSSRPSGVAVSPHGTRLYVTAGNAWGRFLLIDTHGDSLLAGIPVGHTPMNPVPHPGGRLVYVCNRFSNDVSVVDVVARTEAERFPASTDTTAGETGEILPGTRPAFVPGTSYGNSASPAAGSTDAVSWPPLREPVAAAVTPDGASLFVASHLPVPPAVAAAVTVFSTADGSVEAYIPLPAGSTGLRGVCVSPDGRFVYVSHIMARYHLPTTQLERGWMNVNALSVIDAAGKSLLASFPLDDPDRGAANPWALTCSPDGALLAVSHAGTSELSIIDRSALHARLERITEATVPSPGRLSADDIMNDLSFLAGIRRRITLPGQGPRCIVTCQDAFCVGQYFSGTMAVVGAAFYGDEPVKTVHLSGLSAMPVERRGEMLFNDGRMCFQGWQSCASCHPDGRADGLNWDLLNDGAGNPKNTKSLLLSHVTPPVMITGIRPDAETAVRAGMKYIQFVEQSVEDANGVDAYLRSLRPVESPVAADEARAHSIKRGRRVFERAGCSECHPAPLYTDCRPYDVGTGDGREAGRAFDTPALIEVWRTAPYLYDGRAGTMEDVVGRFNAGDMHGVTSGLSDEERADLVIFLRSL